MIINCALALASGQTWNVQSNRTLTVGGALIGPAGMNLSGGRTLVLNGNNTYTDSTTVSNGTLLVNGLLSSTSAVTVVGGTLGGNGTIMGPVTVQSAATLAPAIWELMLGRVGTMSISKTLSLAGTTVKDVDKAVATNDQVRGITTLTYGGTLAVTNLAGTLAAGDSFRLFDATSYTGALATISPASPGIGIVWDSSYLPVDGTLRVAAVPPERPPIRVTFTGGLPVLAWPSGCTLQSANSLLGPWSAVPGAGSPFTVVPIDPSKFYRLILGP